MRAINHDGTTPTTNPGGVTPCTLSATGLHQLLLTPAGVTGVQPPVIVPRRPYSKKIKENGLRRLLPGSTPKNTHEAKASKFNWEVRLGNLICESF